ncbi:hypothetical protein BJY04DRAFT_49392 [Aspergillus karnatakaensis]|uniref:uncharacterized protein n=1 Tax=Aspergillus karnatakaensis TaxID=1810916 RepID=UPI003CCDCF9D
MRFLAGTSGSSSQTSAGGIIADICPNDQQVVAMIFFFSAPLFARARSPVVGGF